MLWGLRGQIANNLLVKSQKLPERLANHSILRPAANRSTIGLECLVEHLGAP